MQSSAGRIRCRGCDQSNEPGARECAFCGTEFDTDADARDLARRAALSAADARDVRQIARDALANGLRVDGIEGMTDEEIADEISRGARFVVFGYCISLVFITMRRSSAVIFVRAGDSAAMVGLPYTLLTLALGWWGIPFGLIYTPMCLFQNLGGGEDVTARVYKMPAPKLN